MSARNLTKRDFIISAADGDIINLPSILSLHKTYTAIIAMLGTSVTIVSPDGKSINDGPSSISLSEQRTVIMKMQSLTRKLKNPRRL